MIDFLKVLLIFFPGCSDRASLASLAKNLWEVDLYMLSNASRECICRETVLSFTKCPFGIRFTKEKRFPLWNRSMAGAKKGSVFVRGAGPVGEKPLSLSPPLAGFRFASGPPSRRTRSSHLAFRLQKIPKWRQLEPVKSIRKKAPKKMFPRSFKVRIFWRIFCWRCVN